MDLSSADYEAARPHLADLDLGQVAPMVMWGALVHLKGDEPIVASLCESAESTDGTTSWQAVWLTETRLLYSQASKGASGWHGHVEDQEADDFIAWVRPLSDVAQLGFAEMSTRRFAREDRRAWEVVYSATLRDGQELTFPLSGQVPNYKSRPLVDDFATALRDRVWRQERG
jgi:hypothetical protein